MNYKMDLSRVLFNSIYNVHLVALALNLHGYTDTIALDNGFEINNTPSHS